MPFRMGPVNTRGPVLMRRLVPKEKKGSTQKTVSSEEQSLGLGSLVRKRVFCFRSEPKEKPGADMWSKETVIRIADLTVQDSFIRFSVEECVGEPDEHCVRIDVFKSDMSDVPSVTLSYDHDTIPSLIEGLRQVLGAIEKSQREFEDAAARESHKRQAQEAQSSV